MGETKITAVGRKKSINGWIALFSGILVLATFTLVAFLLNNAEILSGTQDLGNLSIGVAIVGIIIGIPLVIIGTVIIFRSTRFNDRLDELALAVAYQTRPGQPETSISDKSSVSVQGPTMHCLSCGRDVEQGPYCKYCGAKAGKRDLP